jgi:hypothetical protein
VPARGQVLEPPVPSRALRDGWAAGLDRSKDPASVEDRVCRLEWIGGIALVDVAFEVLELAIQIAVELGGRWRNNEILG